MATLQAHRSGEDQDQRELTGGARSHRTSHGTPAETMQIELLSPAYHHGEKEHISQHFLNDIAACLPRSAAIHENRAYPLPSQPDPDQTFFFFSILKITAKS